jgi:predicted O-methyltransferase YrrM
MCRLTHGIGGSVDTDGSGSSRTRPSDTGWFSDGEKTTSRRETRRFRLGAALALSKQQRHHSSVDDELAVDWQSVVDALMADPPRVHNVWDASGRPLERTQDLVTERSCYELLARHCALARHTLETGVGLSTALFASLGTQHTCVGYAQYEVDRLIEYCHRRGIDTSNVTFHVGGSERVLPQLAIGELDIVFVDGCHGFPLPIVDWFYACRSLRRGGLLVLDDAHLPTVSLLMSFLDRDQRWRRAAGSRKWAAYERLHEGELLEDWWAQPFFPHLTEVEPSSVRRLLGRVRREGRRFARRTSA